MRRIAAAVMSTVLLVAGCSSSGKSPASPGSHDAPARFSATGPIPAGSTITAAVRKAYATLFSNKTTVAQSRDALQHGDVFVATLRQQAGTPHGQQSSASVSKVGLAAPNVAVVRFSITSNGVTALTDVPGKAVLEDGHWKVAATTFCQLLNLEGSAPKACDDPKITALPS
jgi:hypothetical protein